MTAPPDPKFLLRGNVDENIHSLLYWFNYNVEHLYAGDAKGTVHVWDLKINRIKYQLSGGSSPCFNLHTINEADLIIQRRHGIIDIYNVNESSWVLSKNFDYKYCSFCRSQLLPKKKALLIPLDSSVVGMLSLSTFNIDLIFDPSKSSYNDKLGTVMAIKPVTEELILIAYESGQLLLWDMKKNNVLSSLVIEEYPMTFDFDVSLMQGIVGSASNKLEIFSISPDYSLSHKFAKHIDYVSGTSIVCVRPDKRIVAVGFWDGRVILFSWKKLRPLAILKEHKDTIHDIVYSSREVQTYNTRYLMAITGKDGCISLWDIYK